MCMLYNPGIPKVFDTYILIGVEYIEEDNLVKLKIKSTTTGKVFVEQHKLTKYTKTLVSKLIKTFVPSEKRIEWTPYYFRELNYRLNIEPKLLQMKLVYAGYERSKVKSALREADNEEKRQYYLDKLRGSFKSDEEYRNFVPVKEVKEIAMPQLQTVECELVDKEYLLCILQLRGQDTLYFASYNTKTGKQFCTTNMDKIYEYITTSEAEVLMDRPDKDLFTKLFGEWSIIVLQDLLSEHTYSYIHYKCRDIMQLNIPQSETMTVLQLLEAFKYLFNTELQQHLTVRATMLNLIKKNNLNAKPKLSDCCSALFGTGVKSTFSHIEYLDNLYKHVTPSLKDFLTGKTPTIELFGVNLSIGEGLGGLRGCIENYTPSVGKEIVHLDFSSFYPTILLRYHHLLGETIHKDRYVQVYRKKFAGINKPSTQLFKQMLNRTTGLLNKRDGDTPLYNRSAYIAMVKLGHLIMLNFLFAILKNENLRLVNVNTDGCYVEAPIGEKIDVEQAISTLDSMESDFEFVVKETRYANMYIKSVNSYLLLGHNEEVTCKGDFKHVEGNYVRNLVINKYLYGVMYEDTEYTWEDLIYYNDKIETRIICCEGSYNNFRVDTFGLSYIEDKGILPDLNHYYMLADQY